MSTPRNYRHPLTEAYSLGIVFFNSVFMRKYSKDPATENIRLHYHNSVTPKSNEHVKAVHLQYITRIKLSAQLVTDYATER